MTDDEVLVSTRHLSHAHMCMRGARAFMSEHGLSIQHFIDHGYPGSVLLEASGHSAHIRYLVDKAKEYETMAAGDRK